MVSYSEFCNLSFQKAECINEYTIYNPIKILIYLTTCTYGKNLKQTIVSFFSQSLRYSKDTFEVCALYCVNVPATSCKGRACVQDYLNLSVYRIGDV